LAVQNMQLGFGRGYADTYVCIDRRAVEAGYTAEYETVALQHHRSIPDGRSVGQVIVSGSVLSDQRILTARRIESTGEFSEECIVGASGIGLPGALTKERIPVARGVLFACQSPEERVPAPGGIDRAGSTTEE